MGKTAAEVQREIEELRRDTDQVLVELELRARNALDWRSQVRRHPAIAAGAGIALVGGLALAGYASYGRIRVRKKPVGVARRQLGVAEEVFAEPKKGLTWRSLPAMTERSDENLLKRVLYAALTAGVVALATFMARRAVDTIWSKTMQERPPGGVIDKFV